MAGRVNTRDAVKNRQQQAGGVMYNGQAAGDDLFGDDEQDERPWRFTANGLDLKRKLTREEYRNRLLPELQVMESARQLIVGDTYLEGIEDGHIESYEDMAELTGYTSGSIEVYASLCRSIPRLMRINSLTYSHYQKIAPLPEEERPHWIKFAADSELSYRALDALIQWTKGNPQLPAETGSDDNTTIAPAVEPDPPAPVEEEAEEITPLETVKEARKTANTFLRCVAENRLHEMSRGELYAFLQFVQSKYEQRRKMGE